jgi:hypothetical protein
MFSEKLKYVVNITDFAFLPFAKINFRENFPKNAKTKIFVLTLFVAQRQ